MQPQDYISARIRSFGYAFRGLWLLLRDTPHARIHFLATVMVIAAGIYWQVEWTEWALLALSMGLVWSAEAINTALETLTDLASPEIHPLAGKAKDIAAGAVLLAAIFAAAVAGFIFLPRLFA